MIESPAECARREDAGPSVSSRPSPAEHPFVQRAGLATSTAGGDGDSSTESPGKRARRDDARPPVPGRPRIDALSRTLRGVTVPSGWGVHAGSLLVWHFMNPSLAGSKVAAFDFDGCLAKTSVSNQDPKAWSMLFAHVPDVLASLSAQGYSLVVVTNESMDRLKKPDAIRKNVEKKCHRLEAFAKAVGVPLLVLCASAKDHFRKPSTGCWDYLVRTLPVGAAVDLSASFFVGDAAGRMGDHSDSDKAFAEAVGLPFFNEKAFFLERHPPAVS